MNEIQSKDNVFKTLRNMLKFYNGYKTSLNMTMEDAINKTLESYDDFYEWLTRKNEFAKRFKLKVHPNSDKRIKGQK